MIGRGAIRNPWIFSQLTAVFEGNAPPVPSHRDLLEYVIELYDELARETRKFMPDSHVQRMKKTLAYISHGLEGDLRTRHAPGQHTRRFFPHLPRPSRS